MIKNDSEQVVVMNIGQSNHCNITTTYIHKNLPSHSVSLALLDRPHFNTHPSPSQQTTHKPLKFIIIIISNPHALKTYINYI